MNEVSFGPRHMDVERTTGMTRTIRVYVEYEITNEKELIRESLKLPMEHEGEWSDDLELRATALRLSAPVALQTLIAQHSREFPGATWVGMGLVHPPYENDDTH